MEALYLCADTKSAIDAGLRLSKLLKRGQHFSDGTVGVPQEFPEKAGSA
jgi:hypothetical protein